MSFEFLEPTRPALPPPLLALPLQNLAQSPCDLPHVRLYKATVPLVVFPVPALQERHTDTIHPARVPFFTISHHLQAYWFPMLELIAIPRAARHKVYSQLRPLPFGQRVHGYRMVVGHAKKYVSEYPFCSIPHPLLPLVPIIEER